MPRTLTKIPRESADAGEGIQKKQEEAQRDGDRHRFTCAYIHTKHRLDCISMIMDTEYVIAIAVDFIFQSVLQKP